MAALLEVLVMAQILCSAPLAVTGVLGRVAKRLEKLGDVGRVWLRI